MIWLSVVRPSLFSNPIRINQTLSLFANHSFRTTSTVRRSLSSSSWAARKQMLLPRRAQKMNFEQWSYCSTRAFDKRVRERELDSCPPSRPWVNLWPIVHERHIDSRVTHHYPVMLHRLAPLFLSLCVSRSFSHSLKGYLISFLDEQCRMLISFFFFFFCFALE